jgi:hypothetical protein
MQAGERDRIAEKGGFLDSRQCVRAACQGIADQAQPVIDDVRGQLHVRNARGAVERVGDGIGYRVDKIRTCERALEKLACCADFWRGTRFFRDQKEALLAQTASDAHSARVHGKRNGKHERAYYRRQPPQERRIQPVHACSPYYAEKGMPAVTAKCFAPCRLCVRSWR